MFDAASRGRARALDHDDTLYLSLIRSTIAAGWSRHLLANYPISNKCQDY